MDRPSGPPAADGSRTPATLGEISGRTAAYSHGAMVPPTRSETIACGGFNEKMATQTLRGTELVWAIAAYRAARGCPMPVAARAERSC